MSNYTNPQDLRRELDQILDADDYDIDAVEAEYLKRYGLASLEETGDAYALIAIDNQRQEETDPVLEFIAGLTQAIKETPTGEVATFQHLGMKITVSGHSRVNFTTPTPSARFTIQGAPVESQTWESLHEAVVSSAQEEEFEREALWRQLHGQHRLVENLERKTAEARRGRDKTIAALLEREVSDYRIAKELGIAKTTVGAIRRKTQN